MMRMPRELVYAALLAIAVGGCAEGALEPVKIGSLAQQSSKFQPSPPSRIYVANESSNDVSVIDATTFEPLGSIPALNHSTHDLAISRDGRRLYATNLASGRVSVIDAAQRETIASIYTGD